MKPTVTWLFRASLGVFFALIVLRATPGSAARDLYDAEKRFYEASKLKRELLGGMVIPGNDFVDRAVSEFRRLVDDYAPMIETADGMEKIVVGAQMELADLEYRAGRIPEARDDFERVLSIERSIPTARINAHHSAALLSELINDRPHAIELYERLFDEHLTPHRAAATARVDMTTVVVPLKLAELHRESGNPEAEAAWLSRAEGFYRMLAETTRDAPLLKKSRMSLFATYIQQKRWEEALRFAGDLKKDYRSGADRAAIGFLEAKIYQSGLNDRKKAGEACRTVYEDHPDAPEARSAMLLHAAMELNAGNTQRAEQLYKNVLDRYKSDAQAGAEADWQLAGIEESRSDWVAASLRYKAMLTKYPATTYAFRAPLRLAALYERIGDRSSADNAYERALKEYREVIEGKYPIAAKIMAEDYVLQVHTARKDWRAAVEHLIALPDKYPGYRIMQGNYLTAAAIYEKEMGDRERAVETLRTCVEKYPDSEVAKTARVEIERLLAKK